MQAWMSLLDVGNSPTLGRQAALMRGQGEGAANSLFVNCFFGQITSDILYLRIKL
jgi:hypothetical protein